MKMISLATALALSLGCVGIGAAQPAVKIDTSTPENALKSYWAFLDWREHTAAEQAVAYLQSKQHELEMAQRNQLMAGSRLTYEKQRDEKKPTNIFVREIKSVKMQGESKAVIVSHQKNVTAVDSKVDLKSPTQMQQMMLSLKESGDTFQYELERQPSGWRVTDVLKVVMDGMNGQFYVNPPIPYEAVMRIP